MEKVPGPTRELGPMPIQSSWDSPSTESQMALRLPVGSLGSEHSWAGSSAAGVTPHEEQTASPGLLNWDLSHWMQMLAPVDGCTVPGVQRGHADMPVEPPAVPMGHTRQPVALKSGWYIPLAQASGNEAPSVDTNWPGGAGVQAVAPIIALYVPGRQRVHVVSKRAPTALEYVPGSHWIQALSER